MAARSLSHHSHASALYHGVALYLNGDWGHAAKGAKCIFPHSPFLTKSDFYQYSMSMVLRH